MKIRHRKTYFAVSLLINDIFVILASLHFAFWLKFSSGILESPLGMPNESIYHQTFALVVLVMIPVFKVLGLYEEEELDVFANELAIIIRAISYTGALFLIFTFFYRHVSFSRGYLACAWISLIVYVSLSRAILGYAYMFWRMKNNKFKEVLLIGANRDSVKYSIRTLREPRLCTKVIGLLDDNRHKGTTYKKLKSFGGIKDLEAILNDNEDINEVLITQPDLPHNQVMNIILECEKRLVTYKWLPDILGIMATRMRVRYERGIAFLVPRDPKLLEWENRLLKRSVDFMLSVAGLVCIAPLILFVAILIKCDSKGSVFYKQERVGEDGKSFMLYKFRTMKEGAEENTGPVWTSESDHRRTGLGTFLRKTNIDELPQLWNVVKGEMSLVGPRPERPFFVGQFKEDIPRYMGRHQIKAGITGWAQVNGLRGNTSIEERTKYDLYYIENWSVLLDLKILFMTFFAFKNAY